MGMSLVFVLCAKSRLSGGRSGREIGSKLGTARISVGPVGYLLKQGTTNRGENESN